MLGRTNNQRYLLWLALGTATMALAMASLLVFELAQKRAIDRSSALRSDSLTAMVFQFEREFLRVRQALAQTLATPDDSELDALTLRYDIFQSRLTLLRESPSVSLLTERPEYVKVIPQLAAMVGEMDKAMEAKPLDRKVLRHALDELGAMGADVQALTLAADSEVARMLERQTDTMREQNSLIVWLTVAQLVLLIVASGALLVRQKRMEAERLALEKMTDELRQAHFRAEAANRGKSQFLANMSHELRTPFNGLMGMLSLLQTTPTTPQQADYIETAQGSASHLLTLLNDILDLSALETGNITLKPADIALPRLFKDVNALMQPLAKVKGLDFQIRPASASLPLVHADETRIKQILFNLISNAVKFTESGRVTLTVREPLVHERVLVAVFDIQDTGIGMDASVLSKLFQRFYQVDDSSTRRFGGTGLGLEISQSLARMMDGEITVQSQLGVGSTFTVTLRLPLAHGAAGTIAADRAAASATTTTTSTTTTAISASNQGHGEPMVPPEPAVMAQSAPPPAPLTPSEASPASSPAPQTTEAPAIRLAPADATGLRILVVEDHPINQKLLGVLLGRMGCQVSYCDNGQLAVQQVAQSPFDVILMDVNMPIMDGLEATRRIRAMAPPVAETPIVVLTADVMNEANAQALEAGANEFISKPVKVDQLRAALLKYAGGKILL